MVQRHGSSRISIVWYWRRQFVVALAFLRFHCKNKKHNILLFHFHWIYWIVVRMWLDYLRKQMVIVSMVFIEYNYSFIYLFLKQKWMIILFFLYKVWSYYNANWSKYIATNEFICQQHCNLFYFIVFKFHFKKLLKNTVYSCHQSCVVSTIRAWFQRQPWQPYRHGVVRYQCQRSCYCRRRRVNYVYFRLPW